MILYAKHNTITLDSTEYRGLGTIPPSVDGDAFTNQGTFTTTSCIYITKTAFH